MKNCVTGVTKYLNENPNVFSQEVILKKKRVNVIHNTDPETIMEGIRSLGKTAELVSNKAI